MEQEKVVNRLARKLRGDLAKMLATLADLTINSQAKKSNVAEILGNESNSRKKVAKPQNAEEHNQSGIELFDDKKHAEAEATFREAIRLAPCNAAYHSNLGTALNTQNKLDEAENEAELATRLAPNEETCKTGLEVTRNNKNPRTIFKDN